MAVAKADDRKKDGDERDDEQCIENADAGSVHVAEEQGAQDDEQRRQRHGDMRRDLQVLQDLHETGAVFGMDLAAVVMGDEDDLAPPAAGSMRAAGRAIRGDDVLADPVLKEGRQHGMIEELEREQREGDERENGCRDNGDMDQNGQDAGDEHCPVADERRKRGIGAACEILHLDRKMGIFLQAIHDIDSCLLLFLRARRARADLIGEVRNVVYEVGHRFAYRFMVRSIWIWLLEVYTKVLIAISRGIPVKRSRQRPRRSGRRSTPRSHPSC